MRVRRSDIPVLSIVVLSVLVLVCLLAPMLAPHSHVESILAERLRPPLATGDDGRFFLLGTDGQGRDILSRMIVGARVSFIVSIVAIALTSSVGATLGVVAGYVGGAWDFAISRMIDASLAIPAILVALLLAAAFSPSFTNVVIVIGLLLWPDYARVCRGEAMKLKEEDFVTLARAAGCSRWKIMRRHVFPNVLPSVLVLATLHLGLSIILESSMSFLGVGIPPPNPSWGVMISEGSGLLTIAWWLPVFPGLAIVLTVLAMNYVGDWVRDRLDPKLERALRVTP